MRPRSVSLWLSISRAILKSQGWVWLSLFPARDDSNFWESIDCSSCRDSYKFFCKKSAIKIYDKIQNTHPVLHQRYYNFTTMRGNLMKYSSRLSDFLSYWLFNKSLWLKWTTNNKEISFWSFKSIGRSYPFLMVNLCCLYLKELIDLSSNKDHFWLGIGAFWCSFHQLEVKGRCPGLNLWQSNPLDWLPSQVLYC